MTRDEYEALDRLLDIAESDTGQSRRVTNFLLAWWNAGDCGGFDFTDLWNVDTAIAEDMVTLFVAISRNRGYRRRSLPESVSRVWWRRGVPLSSPDCRHGIPGGWRWSATLLPGRALNTQRQVMMRQQG